jgi:hypothetical protein
MIGSSTVSVTFRISCCLCRRAIPLAQDVFELDAEWQRRFPEMRGTLACGACALCKPWRCTNGDGSYIDGHIAADNEPCCVDAWSHVSPPGTHRAMVMSNPRSGLLQGAEAYLRSIATRKGTNPEYAAMLRTVLQEWDEQHSDTVTPQTITA